jgi:hypothetical protein
VTGNRVADKRGTMNESELKFPEWQAPLQDVLLEFNRAKLEQQVQRVEALITERIQQLPRSGNGLEERDAINHALSLLRMIKRDRLGIPT